MAENPLKQYFRQPKIYISLPSKGVYNKIGSIQGDPTNLPVFGMTGMDEIMMKTPDALMTGESTVTVIQSCCPNIKDAWDVNILDTDLIFAAIRIATYGNTMPMANTCSKCSETTEFDVDLTKIIDHYSSLSFDNKIVLDNLAINLHPLNFKQSTEYSLRNFEVQKKLQQSSTLSEEEQKELITQIFKDMAITQFKMFCDIIESVETPTGLVTEKTFIAEWLENCEGIVYDKIKDHFDQNRERMKIPGQTVTCTACKHEDEVVITLDQADFFVNA
jgi:hypothetical protein